MYFSAADLVKKSAAQIKYLRDKKIINRMDKIISITPSDFHNKVLVKGIEKGRVVKVWADVTQLGELGKGIY